MGAMPMDELTPMLRYRCSRRVLHRCVGLSVSIACSIEWRITRKLDQDVGGFRLMRREGIMFVVFPTREFYQACARHAASYRSHRLNDQQPLFIEKERMIAVEIDQLRHDWMTSGSGCAEI
jgi:hypothetical protein